MTASDINNAIINLNKKINFLPCFPPLPDKALHNTPPDLEDALLYEIAMHHKMDYFITSNTKDFKSIQNLMLPVMNAKGFNKILKGSFT